jgi:hypothetical protein
LASGSAFVSGAAAATGRRVWDVISSASLSSLSSLSSSIRISSSASAFGAETVRGGGKGGGCKPINVSVALRGAGGGGGIGDAMGVASFGEADAGGSGETIAGALLPDGGGGGGRRVVDPPETSASTVALGATEGRSAPSVPCSSADTAFISSLLASDWCDRSLPAGAI